MNKEHNRIFEFDLARVASIIWIIAVYHVLPSCGIPLFAPVKIVTYSSLGIFTFLSSFLLSSRYDFSNYANIRLFYKKRILRFYPLFFISSAFLYCIGINDWGSTIKGLVGISPFWEPHPITMWYCAMLISLYAITPLICKGGGIICMLLKICAIMVLVCLIEVFFGCVTPRTFFYYPIYFIGLVFGKYYFDGFIKALRYKKVFCLLITIFVLFLSMVCFIKNHFLIIANSFIGIWTGLSFCLLIGQFIEKNRKFAEMKQCVSMLSYSSMCMYLFHREIHWALNTIFSPENTLTMYLWLGCVGLIVVVLISYFIQKLYDKMINKHYCKTFIS